MATYILDTNIIVLFVRDDRFRANFLKKYSIEDSPFIISVVTEGELIAFSLKRNWGIKRVQKLTKLLNDAIIYPIKTRAIIDAYAKIDTYSQGKLLSSPLPNDMSSRNMGKNDLWIAATANVLDATLITTDKDFDHLNKSFINLDNINLSTFI